MMCFHCNEPMIWLLKSSLVLSSSDSGSLLKKEKREKESSWRGLGGRGSVQGCLFFWVWGKCNIVF